MLARRAFRALLRCDKAESGRRKPQAAARGNPELLNAPARSDQAFHINTGVATLSPVILRATHPRVGFRNVPIAKSDAVNELWCSHRWLVARSPTQHGFRLPPVH
jgi:hypothetical protein